jgi:diketogulonate reductase-like aldo/keto reductase
MALLAFKVRGQEGAIPAIGLGTATLFDERCTNAVREGIKMGYRYIDTALLYNNQEAVGEGIAQAIAAGEVTREQLFVVSKVAFYPAEATADTVDVHIAFEPTNRKGHAATLAAVDLCLAKLKLTHVDLMLIHNPCTNVDEYQASTCPHNFELARARFLPSERAAILASRLATAHARFDAAAGEAARAASWRALEEARAAGKCRFIGVSNYSPYLLRGMEAYATVQPAVNQLELHPRASSPALRALAASMGMVLTAYGSGNSVALEKCPLVAAIAQAHGTSPLKVVLAWTLQRGAGIIPRSATPANMRDNLTAGLLRLSPEELATLDGKNEAHFYCACK